MNSLIMKFAVPLIKVPSPSAIDVTNAMPFHISHPLGFFSITKERKFRSDFSELKFFQLLLEQPLDLSGKLETPYRKWFRHFFDDHIGHTLRAILNNSQKIMRPVLSYGGYRIACDIVCQLELLQTVMVTPYKSGSKWLILAIKFRDTLYLTLENCGGQALSEEERKKSAMEALLKHQMYSAGSNTTRPEECAEFNYLLRSQLKDILIVYSASMNGAAHHNSPHGFSDADIENMDLIECKLGGNSPQADATDDLYTAEEALMWWSEFYLKGAQKFMLALANPSGRVTQLVSVTCEKMRREQQSNWSSHVCLHFLYNVLSDVRQAMAGKDSTTIVYEFYYMPERKIIFVSTDLKRQSFVPEWYARALGERPR